MKSFCEKRKTELKFIKIFENTEYKCISIRFPWFFLISQQTRFFFFFFNFWFLWQMICVKCILLKFRGSSLQMLQRKAFWKNCFKFQKISTFTTFVRNLQAGNLQFLRNYSVSVFFTFDSGKFQRSTGDSFYMILLISEISLSCKMNAVSSDLHCKQVSGEFVS